MAAGFIHAGQIIRDNLGFVYLTGLSPTMTIACEPVSASLLRAHAVERLDGGNETLRKIAAEAVEKPKQRSALVLAMRHQLGCLQGSALIHEEGSQIPEHCRDQA